MKMILKITMLLSILVSVACKKNPIVTSKDELKSKISAAAKANHIPTMSVLIKWKDDELKFLYKDNASDIEQVNVYGIGSTTKMLSSLLILKYIEDGKIDLEASITKYIDKTMLSQIPWVDSIKVRNLLSNTSGIPDYIQNPDWIKMAMAALPPKNTTEKVKLIAAPDSTFKLGRFSYSSSNFVILEMILESITHHKATDIFNAFYAQLGLTHTSFNKPTTGNQAFFAQTVDGVSNVSAWEEDYGFEGGAYSTTEDLSKLMQLIFIDKTVINSKSLANMQTWTDTDKFKLNYGNGKITHYGLGLMKYELGGRTFIGHPGSTLKYQSFAFIEPATGIQVILLTNCSGKHYNHAVLIEIIDQIISQNI